MEHLLKSYRLKIKQKRHSEITQEERDANSTYCRKYKDSRALASANYRIRTHVTQMAIDTLSGDQ